MAFVRLEPVERQDPGPDSPVGLNPRGRGGLPGRAPRLRPAHICLDRLSGPVAPRRVVSRQTSLRHRPMAGTAPLAKPAHHLPAQTPARHAEGPCGCGAARAPPTLACGGRATHQAVDHLRRSLQGPKMMRAMIAPRHGTVTDGAGPILDIPGQPAAYGPYGPTRRHGHALLLLKSLEV
jgi:hypothetical protein